MTLPVVKHSYLVLNAEDLPRIVKEAFYLAESGRPGPVVIDIPKDVQQAVFEPFFPSEVGEIPGYKLDLPKATDEELTEVLRLITEANKPVLYTGGGILSGDAHEELKEFAEVTGLPVTHTLMGLGVFDPAHPQSLYWYGMHGTVAGNWAVCESDLLLCAGARFDDRITGKVDKYAQEAYVIHFDVDKAEHNKNVHAHFPIQTDIKYALKRLCELANEQGFQKPDLTEWFSSLDKWKAENPFRYHKGEHITSQEAVEALYEESKGEAIITTGVGQHQMWAAQYYKFKDPRTYISSLGLGTMGFGYPAAVGVKVARPDKEVIDIDGDGSFLMNVQELATAKIEKINAKCLLLNNQHLGMVVQWEDRFYESVRGHTILCDPENLGGPDNLDAIYPDFITMAAGFGVKARRISKREDLRDGIREMLEADEPYLLEVIVPYTEHVLPMIPQGKSAKEILTD
jgi:acetolactate synthase-1/2/3 large subunit